MFPTLPHLRVEWGGRYYERDLDPACDSASYFEHKVAGSIPGCGSGFSGRSKKQDACGVDILAHVKDSQEGSKFQSVALHRSVPLSPGVASVRETPI